MTIPEGGLAFEMLIQIKIRGRTYTVRGEESGDTIKSVKLYRSPLRGSTTMMLPMVCDRFLVSMMTLAWLQWTP